MRILSPRAGLVAAVCLAFAVTACETPVEAPPPPPSSVAVPPVSLNSGVTEAAAVYLAYIQGVATIPSTFSDGGAIRSEMIRASTWEPVQMSRGIVAYSAIVALQSPEFVNGIRQLAATPGSRDTMIRRILTDPAYAAALPGAADAAGLIASQVGGQGQAFYAAGAAVKQTAYDIQRQRWSSQHVTDRESRMDNIGALGQTAVPFDVDTSARLQQAALTGQGLGLASARSDPPFTPMVIRSLALAALAALGSAGEESRSLTDALMVEYVTGECFRFNKLMVQQCLAASRPHYEEVFCLGQHMMMDAAQCVIDSAGTVTYAPPPAVPDLVPAATETVQTPN